MTEPDLSLGRAASAAEGDLRLPKPPGIIRRFWGRHVLLADTLIAIIALFPAMLDGLMHMFSRGQYVAGFVILGCGLLDAAALMLRRKQTRVCFGITIAILLVGSPFGAASTLLAVLVALYSLAVYRSTAAGWIGFGITALAGATSELLAPGGFDSTRSLSVGSQIAVVALAVTLIGINVGNRKRYLFALIDRAQQLARERDQQARLSAAAERTRIAREMHDIVSHSLTVMVSLADGSAALTRSEPSRAEEAMNQVAETGRHALTDMRRMLGLLSVAERTDAEREAEASDFEPQPRASDLDTLADRLRSAGMPLRFSVTGGAPDDQGLQLTVYRIVQESLTNALRHAPDATRVDAAVRYGEDGVTVQIDDDGHGFGAMQGGAQRGLVGMQERVSLYGGTLQSGPRRAGGWRVHADIPRNGAIR